MPPGPTGAGGVAARALEIGTAIQQRAHLLLAFEAGFAAARDTGETMAGDLRGWIQETNARLTGLELQLGAGATISEAQAAEIALAVKNIGQARAAQGDRPGDAQVYSAMYRRWGNSSYKALPRAEYAAVVDWLRACYDSGAPGPGDAVTRPACAPRLPGGGPWPPRIRGARTPPAPACPLPTRPRGAARPVSAGHRAAGVSVCPRDTVLPGRTGLRPGTQQSGCRSPCVPGPQQGGQRDCVRGTQRYRR